MIFNFLIKLVLGGILVKPIWFILLDIGIPVLSTVIQYLFGSVPDDILRKSDDSEHAITLDTDGGV